MLARTLTPDPDEVASTTEWLLAILDRAYLGEDRLCCGHWVAVDDLCHLAGDVEAMVAEGRALENLMRRMEV